MKPYRLVGILIVVFSTHSSLAEDREWGHLSGRIVYDGEPPTPKKIEIVQDRRVFGEFIEDETLVVNQENRGLANVIIYLLPRKDEDLKIHPSYEKQDKVTLAMDDGKFVPHVLLMRTDQPMFQETPNR